jgi:hypothetical protein
MKTPVEFSRRRTGGAPDNLLDLCEKPNSQKLCENYGEKRFGALHILWFHVEERLWTLLKPTSTRSKAARQIHH